MFRLDKKGPDYIKKTRLDKKDPNYITMENN